MKDPTNLGDCDGECDPDHEVDSALPRRRKVPTRVVDTVSAIRATSCPNVSIDEGVDDGEFYGFHTFSSIVAYAEYERDVLPNRPGSWADRARRADLRRARARAAGVSRTKSVSDEES